jgi:hypothetical protein
MYLENVSSVFPHVDRPMQVTKAHQLADVASLQAENAPKHTSTEFIRVRVVHQKNFPREFSNFNKTSSQMIKLGCRLRMNVSWDHDFSENETEYIQ